MPAPPQAQPSSASVVTPRRALALLLFFGSSALAAFALAAALRVYLPYEAFDRGTAEEQFLFWEGVTWLAGLVLVFFGAAAAFGTLQWSLWGIPGYDEYRAQRRGSLASPFSLVPLWMLLTGAMLIVAAIRERALPG